MQPPTLNRYVYTLNNPLKYVDLRGNAPLFIGELRYSGYTSPQFNSFSHSTTSWGLTAGLEFDLKKYGLIKSVVNIDSIVSGEGFPSVLIHPIYKADNLDFSWKWRDFLGSIEHTSFHAQSLGILHPSPQLKDFPSINGYGGGNRFFIDDDAGFLLQEDFFKSNSYEETRYFGKTDIFSLAYFPSSNLETLGGYAESGGYSTLNSVLGLKGPPVLISGEGSYSGLFGRAVLKGDTGTLSLAGVGGSNPFFAAGFQSENYNLAGNWLGAKFFGMYGSTGNCGFGVTCSVGVRSPVQGIIKK